MSPALRRLTQFVRTDTARLMTTYLCIIMIMSLSFSTVLYITSVTQLERQRPHATINDDFPLQTSLAFRQFINQRIDESKQEILLKLSLINLLVLAGGILFSYFLARRTLLPIERAMTAQTQFVSDASHELRTPLTALRTMNEVALRRKKLSLKDAKQTIGDTLGEVERLQQLTDGLLGLVGHDTLLTRQSVKLQTIVDTALTSVAPAADAKQIAVDNQTPPLTLNADQGALTQVITILLDNAVKYSPAKSLITVGAARQAHTIRIWVRDQGQGINANDAPHVFSRFYRADHSRSQTPGYGLGLAIAHKLVSAHHGVLRFESTPGEGSTFIIELPGK